MKSSPLLSLGSTLVVTLCALTIDTATAWYVSATNETCAHDECNDFKPSNTHLRVVNQALAYLTQVMAPNSTFAQRIVDRMNETTCRNNWEQALWDTDATTTGLDEYARPGSHFYNPTKSDFFGWPLFGCKTSKVLYFICHENNGNARTNSNDNIKAMSNLWTDDSDCTKLGYALHYITDVEVPFHSKSLSVYQKPFFYHTAYEQYASYRQTESVAGDSLGDVADQLPKWGADISISSDDAFHEVAVFTATASWTDLRKAMESWNKWHFWNNKLVLNGDSVPDTPEMQQVTDILLARAYYLTAYWLWYVFVEQPV